MNKIHLVLEYLVVVSVPGLCIIDLRSSCDGHSAIRYL